MLLESAVYGFLSKFSEFSLTIFSLSNLLVLLSSKAKTYTVLYRCICIKFDV